MCPRFFDFIGGLFYFLKLWFHFTLGLWFRFSFPKEISSSDDDDDDGDDIFEEER